MTSREMTGQVQSSRPSVDVRIFEGNVGEFASFVCENWQSAYRARAVVPAWTTEFFEWQYFRKRRGLDFEVLACYDGDELLGVFPVEMLQVCLNGERALVSLSSWLTVKLDRQRIGLGTNLKNAMMDWSSQRGAFANLGYVNSQYVPGNGKGFWSKYSEGARFFEHPRLWLLKPERALCSRDEFVQSYDCRLRTECVDLLRKADLPFSLAHYHCESTVDAYGLSNDVARSYVKIIDGAVRAYIAVYLVPLSASSGMIAHIDFVAGESENYVVGLIADVAARLIADGAELVMARGKPVVDSGLLNGLGFTPSLGGYALMCTPLDCNVDCADISTVNIIFR